MIYNLDPPHIFKEGRYRHREFVVHPSTATSSSQRLIRRDPYISLSTAASECPTHRAFQAFLSMAVSSWGRSIEFSSRLYMLDLLVKKSEIRRILYLSAVVFSHECSSLEISIHGRIFSEVFDPGLLIRSYLRPRPPAPIRLFITIRHVELFAFL